MTCFEDLPKNSCLYLIKFLDQIFKIVVNKDRDIFYLCLYENERAFMALFNVLQG